MEVDRQVAEGRVRGPAIGMIVTAGVGAMFCLTSLALHLLGAGMSPMAGNGQEVWAAWFSGVAGVIGGLVGLAAAGFMVWGAFKMMRLESHGIALATCIVALVPCVSPCCLLGLPLGIWGLIVINDPAVKQAFR